MDPTEDLSARVLLRNILSTEPLQTPITRSTSNAQGPSGQRRSSRLSKKDAGAQTPQEIMRRSMKHKLRESITRKSLPATTRRTATSGLLRQTNTPGLTSMLFDDDDTPRHLLKNILQTEPVRSPVVNIKAASEEPRFSSARSSISSKRPSIELSGLDLPDLTLGSAGTLAKGLSRKRPRRSLNVTAFEKRLKDASDFQEEHEESAENCSSLSLSSSTSLSLKTPFVDVRSEKRGLQRRVSNRRKITEEEFGAAVNKQWMGDDHVKGVDLNHSTYSEGFTLGLSELSEPNITTDIINCNTALYTHSDPMTSTFSILATQDKDTVMATQLQRQMTDREESKLGKDETGFVFPTEVGVMAELQNEEPCLLEGQLEEEVDAAEENGVEAQTEERDRATESQTEEEEDNVEDSIKAASQSDEEEAEPQSEKGDVEDRADDSQSVEDEVRSQSEEEEVEIHSEKEGEDGADDSQSVEDEVRSQSEEEEVEIQSEKGEDGADDSPPVEDEVRSQSEEEEEVEIHSEKGDGEEGPDDFKSGEDVEAGFHSEEEAEPESEKEGADYSEFGEDVEAGSQSEELGDDGEDYQHDQEDPDNNSHSEGKDVIESRDEDEHEEEEKEGEQASEQLEHISRRAHHSQGGLVVPFAEAERNLPDVTERGRSKVHSADDLHIGLEMGASDGSPPRSGTPDVEDSLTSGPEAADCVADGENSFHLEMTHDIEEGSHLRDALPEDAAADPVEQEEEWEDEEIEEFPCKTPAFVKEKRNFFLREHETSPSVHKNIQTSRTSEAVPAAKPKRVQERKRGPVTKQASLPKSYLMSVFRHFAKTKVSSDIYPVLQETMDQFFDRMADDLETYANHAKRKTIDFEDTVLLLKRLGYVNDKVPVEVLIEKYLRMDQRKLLIPIATSGNVVVPKRR